LCESRVKIDRDVRDYFQGRPQHIRSLGRLPSTSAIEAAHAQHVAACARMFAVIRTAPASERAAIASRGLDDYLDVTASMQTVHTAAIVALGASDGVDYSGMSDRDQLDAYSADARIRAQIAYLTAKLGERVQVIAQPAASRFTVSAMLDSLIETTPASELSKESADRKRQRLSVFIAFAGDMSMDDPTFRTACMRFFKHRTALGAQYGTLRIDASDLAQLGAHAAKVHRLFNPCLGLVKDLGKAPPAAEHSFKPRETRAMLAAAAAQWDPDHAAALAFLVYTGCRLGDMMRLQACDYRPLTQDESDAGHGPAAMMIIDINEDNGTAKKGGRRDTVRLAPCHPDLAPILAAAAARNAGGRMFAGVKTDNAFYKRHVGLIASVIDASKDDRALSCHSWRHTSWTVAMRAKPAAWTREQWLAFVGKASEAKTYKGERLKAGDLAPLLAGLDLGANGRGSEAVALAA
jgi:integrase